MKRIALCFDGTWNTPKNSDHGDEAPTNVWKLFQAIAAGAEMRETAFGSIKRDADQVAWYHRGVGTGDWYDRLTGGINGAGLDDNIRHGFRFLAETFDEGDDIMLFGFSRGAYTARSLGGMIRKCGVLRRDRADRDSEAMALYRKRDVTPDSDEAVAFREANSRSTRIACIGVWDTVGSLGVPLRLLKGFNAERYAFHDTKLSKIIVHGFHAVAIDEHRDAFLPTLWDDARPPGQTIEQRWFPGAHANIGGGYADHLLSDISLAWMTRNATRCGLRVAETPVAVDAAAGKLRDSYAEFLGWFYRIFHRRHYRDILLASESNETVDRSVAERRRLLNYWAKNLDPYKTTVERYVRDSTRMTVASVPA